MPRVRVGNDGADIAAFVVQAACTIARAGRRRTEVEDAVLWYLALTSAHNYGAAGWAKLISPPWRSGEVVTEILRTRGYGHEGLWRWLDRHPRSARLLGTGLLGWECLFPIVLVGPGRRLAPAFVAAAAAFHAVNARAMGLNRFLTAFAAMHPAVLYAAGPPDGVDAAGRREHRSDALPAVAAAVGAVAVALAWADNARRRRLVSGGTGDERLFRTSSGSLLRYRLRGPDGPGAPLVVCVNGLGAGAEYWTAVTDRLAGDCAVLTYQRAGYPGSRTATGRRPSVELAVADLADLVRSNARGRPVVLLAHSLGGYLAWRAAERVAAEVGGVVLVDSSHPDRPTTTGSAGPAAAEEMRRNMTAALRWLRLGFGALRPADRSLDPLPPPLRRLVDAQLRHPGTARAALDEWESALRAPAATEPGAPAVPLVVLTAARTAQNAAALRLHRDLAASGPLARHAVVPDCNHDTVLLLPAAADVVAGHVRQVVAEARRPVEVAP